MLHVKNMLREAQNTGAQSHSYHKCAFYILQTENELAQCHVYLRFKAVYMKSFYGNLSSFE